MANGSSGRSWVAWRRSARLFIGFWLVAAALLLPGRLSAIEIEESELTELEAILAELETGSRTLQTQLSAANLALETALQRLADSQSALDAARTSWTEYADEAEAEILRGRAEAALWTWVAIGSAGAALALGMALGAVFW